LHGLIPWELSIVFGAFIVIFESKLKASPSKYPTPSSKTIKYDRHGSVEKECQPDYGRPRRSEEKGESDRSG